MHIWKESSVPKTDVNNTTRANSLNSKSKPKRKIRHSVKPTEEKNSKRPSSFCSSFKRIRKIKTTSLKKNKSSSSKKAISSLKPSFIEFIKFKPLKISEILTRWGKLIFNTRTNLWLIVLSNFSIFKSKTKTSSISSGPNSHQNYNYFLKPTWNTKSLKQ